METIWDKLWRRFDESMNGMQREMQELKTPDGTVKMIYENGSLIIKVNGPLKFIQINDRKIQVKPNT